MLSQMHPAVYAAMKIVHFTMPGSCRAAVGWPPTALHDGGNGAGHAMGRRPPRQ
jgi:hypothetical protein